MGIFDKFKKQVKNEKNEDDRLNVERTNVIDGVIYDEKEAKLVLLLADGMDWRDEARHIILLQDKLNTYVTYIENKQYEKKYTNVNKIEIQIKFLFKETDTCRKFLEQVNEIITTQFENTSITLEQGTEDTYVPSKDE